MTSEIQNTNDKKVYDLEERTALHLMLPEKGNEF